MFERLFGKKPKGREPRTVTEVDVSKYCGTWYEIASYQPKEQRRCTRTKAEYTLNKEGYVDVRNSCIRKGREKSVTAKAFPVAGSGNAKLKVQFFRLFKGDYWVVDLADDYYWAVVSTPTSRSLWVLSRTPYMSEEVYAQITERLDEQGFDTVRLIRTDQKR